jgi:hypothetical protein
VPVLLRAFNTYVRPALEYASCIWSPYRKSAIEQVESVQRKFTKRLPGYAHSSYDERLIKLGLQSLEVRRLRQDLINTYKILFGLLDVNASDFFTLADSGHNTRGHRYKLSTHFCRVDARKYFFAERVERPWNSLAAECGDFTSLSTFKSLLDRTNLMSLLK